MIGLGAGATATGPQAAEAVHPPAGTPSRPLQGPHGAPAAGRAGAPLEQLRLAGDPVLVPLRTPRRLTEHQRDALRWARCWGQLTTADARRWWADPSGGCARLVALGLLERAAPGRFRPGAGKDWS